MLSFDQTASVAPDVSLEVEDIDLLHAQAIQRGLQIVHPLTNEPWGVRRFFVTDPNGKTINLMAHHPNLR